MAMRPAPHFLSTPALGALILSAGGLEASKEAVTTASSRHRQSPKVQILTILAASPRTPQPSALSPNSSQLADLLPGQHSQPSQQLHSLRTPNNPQFLRASQLRAKDDSR
mmetsp:Transcript_24252/g.38104  ORF Transcript_24252/g.38104 Transcript_24252/m.38104 type:complete len:110 (-) Transcript_24252:11-340(-)